MSIEFADNIFPDWLELYRNKKLQKKMEQLMKELERNPLSSLAKAELLKGDRSGCRSMRIDDYHRLVYRVEDGKE